jgi:hypothetical protein
MKSCGSKDSRHLLPPFDALPLLREVQRPLMEVRPASIRIMFHKKGRKSFIDELFGGSLFDEVNEIF